jgi:RNA polymerase sigma-70 factor (ECF subfamily)
LVSAYIHTNQYLYIEYFLKTGTLEINNQIESKKRRSSGLHLSIDYYWNEVYGFMLKRTENETSAEDITIETFSKAFDKIASYNPEFSLTLGLLVSLKNVYRFIAQKEIESFVEITDKEDQKAYNIADTTPSKEDELITEQNLSQLLRYIKELKPHYQEVIQLRYFQEMSYQEIANKIDEPLSNVKIKLLRAKNY